jgi:hypothetical protein
MHLHACTFKHQHIKREYLNQSKANTKQKTHVIFELILSIKRCLVGSVLWVLRFDVGAEMRTPWPSSTIIGGRNFHTQAPVELSLDRWPAGLEFKLTSERSLENFIEILLGFNCDIGHCQQDWNGRWCQQGLKRQIVSSIQKWQTSLNSSILSDLEESREVPLCELHTSFYQGKWCVWKMSCRNRNASLRK